MRSSLFLALLALFVPTSAHSLGIVVADLQSTGASTSILEVGDRITFGLRIENPNQEPMLALGIVAFGYDSALAFGGGSSNSSFFNELTVTGIPIGGLQNVIHPYEDRYFQGSLEPNPQ